MEKNRNSINVGVDIGGTKIALGFVTSEGKLTRQKSFPTSGEKGPDWIIEHLIEEIKSFVEKAQVEMHNINSIGIGVPGTVELTTGNVVLAPNIYWRNIPLGEKLKAGFPKIPIYIDQDTNTAVLGEYFACEDVSVENLFFITISTGIGSGLILNKTLYRGRLNMAGEIGHTVVEKDGVSCTCGSRGCLQAYAKGPALVETTIQRIKHGETSCLAEQMTNGQLTAVLIAEAASDGDPLAQEALLNAAEYVGIALANVVTLLNPDLIIIGGGVARSGNWFIDKIREVTRSHCYPPARESFRIELTTNWEKSPLIGAGLLYKTL